MLDGAPPPGVLRQVVVESWQRSAGFGLPAEHTGPPSILDEAELEERRMRHPLRAMLPLIRALLVDVAEEARHVVAVCDASGHLLWVEGNRTTRRAADDIGFVPGADWSEGSAGTNAPGTSLAADRAIQVFASEHYNGELGEWMCAAAPIHDPDGGDLIGALDLTASYDATHPAVLALARAAAAAVEAQLHALLAVKDAEALDLARTMAGGSRRVAVLSPGGRVLGDDLGRRRVAAPAEAGALRVGRGLVDAERLAGSDGYWMLRPHGRRREVATLEQLAPLELRLLGAPGAAVLAHGRQVPVAPRQVEICALLALHPDGLTSARLRELLYGAQDVAEVTVRSELSRLRRALGPALVARPYRFAVAVTTDLERVEQLLHSGDLRAAIGSYAGPLLPWSESPRICDLRDQLTYELRAALLVSDDADALFQWIRSPHGGRDAAVARRLTTLVSARDPRRAAAVAVVEADLLARA